MAVQPALVRALASMPAAAILQQLHYRLEHGDAWDDDDGHRWAPSKYADLARETGLTADQARRSIELLTERGVIESRQVEAFNRRKSYRIDYDHELLQPVVPGRNAVRTGAGASSEVAGAPVLPLSEVRETPPAGAGQEPVKPPRARNVTFDALAAVFPAETRSEQSRIAKVARELEALKPPPTPGIVERVARWILNEWPKSTVMAVSAHWTQALNASRNRPAGGSPGALMERCEACGHLPPDCTCPDKGNR